MIFLERVPNVDLVTTERFRQYVEHTWVGRFNEDGTFLSRPLFDHLLWNSRIATTDVGIRTNNNVESWHLNFADRMRSRGNPGVSFAFCFCLWDNFYKKQILNNTINLLFFSCANS